MKKETWKDYYKKLKKRKKATKEGQKYWIRPEVNGFFSDQIFWGK